MDRLSDRVAAQGMPGQGWLTGNHFPTDADFAAAFPLVPPDWQRLANPPCARTPPATATTRPSVFPFPGRSTLDRPARAPPRRRPPRPAPPLAAHAVQATWLGHASTLVQMHGQCFLTDPIQSLRCSPVQWAGPKARPPPPHATDPLPPIALSPLASRRRGTRSRSQRVVPPPLDLLDARMPRIDFVVISHSHYDHLDAGTVRQLRDAHGDAVRWYVPLGLRAWMAGAGVRNCVELDWWEARPPADPPSLSARPPARAAL